MNPPSGPGRAKPQAEDAILTRWSPAMFRTPTLWKYTTREVQRRPGRTLLTLLGIVIGVATVVAIMATTRATRRSYRAMYEAVGGAAALEVVAPGGGGFDPQEAYRSLRG